MGQRQQGVPRHHHHRVSKAEKARARVMTDDAKQNQPVAAAACRSYVSEAMIVRSEEERKMA